MSYYYYYKKKKGRSMLIHVCNKSIATECIIHKMIRSHLARWVDPITSLYNTTKRSLVIDNTFHHKTSSLFNKRFGPFKLGIH